MDHPVSTRPNRCAMLRRNIAGSGRGERVLECSFTHHDPSVARTVTEADTEADTDAERR